MGYENILLKLSGASISDVNDPFNYAKIDAFVAKVKKLVKEGKHIAIVVGGGNIWRGKTASELGMDRAQADYMGMLATVMNGLAVQDALEHIGVPTRVLSALSIDEVAENLLMMGGKPVGSIKKMMEIAQIEEAEDESIKTKQIFKEVLKDFNYLLGLVIEIKVLADEQNNYLISSLMDDYIKQVSKSIWMINQVIDD